MSPNVYLCIVSSIRIAYCFLRIAIRIVSVFFPYRPSPNRDTDMASSSFINNFLHTCWYLLKCYIVCLQAESESDDDCGDLDAPPRLVGPGGDTNQPPPQQQQGKPVHDIHLSQYFYSVSRLLFQLKFILHSTKPV